MRKFVYAVLIAAASVCAWLCQTRMAESSAAQEPLPANHESRAANHESPSPVVDVLVSVLGGFRGILAEIVWFRAERLQDEGRYGELVQLSTYLTLLEPRTPEVWSYAAWNLAYNVSVMMPTLEDRWRWVEAAVKMLRDDALRLNPRDSVLHRELAWTFLAKIGGSLDEASPIYRAKWRETVSAARAKGDWASLRMDEARMAAVDGEYGKMDWENPLASAIYWAHFGLACAREPADRVQLRQVVYQSLMLLTVRDRSFAARTLKEIETARAESRSPFLDHLAERFREKYVSPAAK